MSAVVTGSAVAISAAAISAAASSAAGAVLAVVYVVLAAFAIFEIAAFWRIFTKAGRSGWASIVPVYNAYVVLKIAGRPGWWILLCIIPFVNVVIAIIAIHELSKSFGHGGGFTLGLLCLPMVFYPLLAFGSDRYIGPGGARQTGSIY